MGNHNRRAFCHHQFQRLLNLRLRKRIDIRRRLIQYKNARRFNPIPASRLPIVAAPSTNDYRARQHGFECRQAAFPTIPRRLSDSQQQECPHQWHPEPDSECYPQLSHQIGMESAKRPQLPAISSQIKAIEYQAHRQ